MDREKVLSVENISKTFPGVKALNNISLDLYKGEVLVLVGENGAGKSTFVKILSGIYMADEGGKMTLDQEAYIPTDDNGNYTDRERVKQCKEDFYASLRKIFGSA